MSEKDQDSLKGSGKPLKKLRKFRFMPLCSTSQCAMVEGKSRETDDLTSSPLFFLDQQSPQGNRGTKITALSGLFPSMELAPWEPP